MPIAMRYGSNDYTRSGGASGGGSGGGITMSLLWTNPSPTSNFAAQTVSLDLSGFDAVMVVMKLKKDLIYVSWNFGFIGDTAIMSIKGNATGTMYGRTAEINAQGIVFGTGYSASTSSNEYGIPAKIYGIKGIT